MGRSPGEGKRYPLQYSGLENSMECIVLGVAKSQTRLSDFQVNRGFPDGSVGKESTCNAGDPVLTPRSGRSAGEGIGYLLPVFLGFLCGSAGKESTCNVGRPGFSSWIGKIPWRRETLPTPVFWPGEFHGLHSPWVPKNGTGLSLSLTLNWFQNQPSMGSRYTLT